MPVVLACSSQHTAMMIANLLLVVGCLVQVNYVVQEAIVVIKVCALLPDVCTLHHQSFQCLAT
jgi:hypothetical protein